MTLHFIVFFSKLLHCFLTLSHLYIVSFHFRSMFFKSMGVSSALGRLHTLLQASMCASPDAGDPSITDIRF